MKSSLLLLSLIVAVTASQAQAGGSASSYVQHHKLQGKNARHGSFDIDYVQLVSRAGRPLTAEDLMINKALTEQAKGMLCSPNEQNPASSAESISSQTTDVTFVSDRLLAMTAGQEISCAGTAHPDFGSVSTVYDRSTGQKIDIRTGQPSADEAPASVSTKKINAVLVDALVAKAKIEKKERGDNECDGEYSREALSTIFSFSISVTPRSLIVSNSPSHAAMACVFSATVPLTKFVGVAPKGSLLDQLARGAAKAK